MAGTIIFNPLGTSDNRILSVGKLEEQVLNNYATINALTTSNTVLQRQITDNLTADGIDETGLSNHVSNLSNQHQVTYTQLGISDAIIEGSNNKFMTLAKENQITSNTTNLNNHTSSSIHYTGCSIDHNTILNSGSMSHSEID